MTRDFNSTYETEHTLNYKYEQINKNNLANINHNILNIHLIVKTYIIIGKIIIKIEFKQLVLTNLKKLKNIHIKGKTK